MLGDSKQASSATTSLVYLTVGALIDVWAIVYLIYLRNHTGSDIAYLFVYGFIFTGMVLFLIGLAVGRIGHSARSAEVAPVPTQQIVAPAAAAAPLPEAAAATTAPAPAVPGTPPVQMAPSVAATPTVPPTAAVNSAAPYVVADPAGIAGVSQVRS